MRLNLQFLMANKISTKNVKIKWKINKQKIFLLFTVGPCALDYTKTKTPDQYWNDPPADELVQRHRISSGHTTPPSCRKTSINVGALRIIDFQNIRQKINFLIVV